nr:immunoglobulin light chain junction region [Macaca mulatta]MOX22180.1 immunoglobulin light chain junction region [Macaca mulatta]MOX36455.1 immunoglobulin light chain junction region [Macaca mulatta]MOY07112.1 immunoglobulin light chain junction region [Macaca mulatta]
DYYCAFGHSSGDYIF